MKVLIEKDDNNLILECIGRIDTVSAPEFRKEISIIDFSNAENVILDFKNVPYISSAGLRELLILKRKLKENSLLQVRNASEDVVEVIKVTGFSEFVDVIADNKAVDYSNMSFSDFLAYKVEHDENKPILTYEGYSYTWTSIDLYASMIAENLYRLGVRKGSHVGICGINSLNWIFTFYAIQKLGAIALLLNPQLTETEIIRFANIGDITHLCYGEIPQIPDMMEVSHDIISNSSIEKMLSIKNEVDFSLQIPQIDSYEASVNSDDACVMVFTSGSTGTPKGVLLSAYNIINASLSNIESLRITSNDKACLILPLFHIFGLVAGLVANAVADANMIIPKDIHTDTIIQTVSKNKCTIMHSVPTLFLAILNNKNFKPEDFASLRSTILSGAATAEAHMRMFKELFPNNHFASSYGMSEMAPISITDYEDTIDHICYTVGKPIKNIQVRIFDIDKKKECDVNQVGEIQVQGYNLMTCYYKVSIEKQSIDADGWMSTGDLGSFDEEGYIHFVGRLKELIIRGGENIIPNEIISAICEEDYIRDAKVYGVPDDFFGERVAAAIILNDYSKFDEEKLRESLKNKLAKFKIPDYFVIYGTFPTLSNGKVDSVKLKNDLIEKIKNANLLSV